MKRTSKTITGISNTKLFCKVVEHVHAIVRLVDLKEEAGKEGISTERRIQLHKYMEEARKERDKAYKVIYNFNTDAEEKAVVSCLRDDDKQRYYAYVGRDCE